jgi:hypothetical protein
LRKASILIFMEVSALALLFIFYTSRPPFDPAVDLPEVEAGEAFRSWNGVVVTRLPDGRFDIDGQTVPKESAAKALEKALRARENEFMPLTKSVKLQVPFRKLTMVPVLVCIDKRSPVRALYDVLDVIYPAGCANVYIACSTGGGNTAVSLPAPYGGFRSIDDRCVWHGQVCRVGRNMQEIKGRVRKDGRWRISSGVREKWLAEKPFIIFEERALDPKTGKWRLVGNPRPTYETLDSLFDLIEEHRDKDVVIMLDLNERADHLTWDWLVKLLARLERTGIKGYCFAAPEFSF